MNKLHIIKFDEAMQMPDASKWIKAVEEDHDRMQKYNVWEPDPESQVPENAKILTSTWAMKKKSNGTYRARLNARGHEQIDGEHYDWQSIASPVANEVTIRVMLTLMVMAG